MSTDLSTSEKALLTSRNLLKKVYQDLGTYGTPIPLPSRTAGTGEKIQATKEQSLSILG